MRQISPSFKRRKMHLSYPVNAGTLMEHNGDNSNSLYKFKVKYFVQKHCENNSLTYIIAQS